MTDFYPQLGEYDGRYGVNSKVSQYYVSLAPDQHLRFIHPSGFDFKISRCSRPLMRSVAEGLWMPIDISFRAINTQQAEFIERRRS